MDGSAFYALFFFVILPACLAFIPANIAANKGRAFGLWWVYGFLLFIVALIHALLLKTPEQRRAHLQGARGTSDAEELEKFARLRDTGVITDAEFETKKRALLGT